MGGDFFFFLGGEFGGLVCWEESVWPERSASGLEHGFFCGGGSPSNSKEEWNLDESVGVCPPIIQSFKLLGQPHKRAEQRGYKEDGETKAPVFTSLYLSIMDSIKHLHDCAQM